MSIYQSARKAKNAETPSLTSIPSLMWTTLGQDHLLKQLDAALRAGRLAHAYLLTGPPHVGKMTLALELAAAVNCAGREPGDAMPGLAAIAAACTRIRRERVRRFARSGGWRRPQGSHPYQYPAD